MQHPKYHTVKLIPDDAPYEPVTVHSIAVPSGYPPIVYHINGDDQVIGFQIQSDIDPTIVNAHTIPMRATQAQRQLPESTSSDSDELFPPFNKLLRMLGFDRPNEH